MSSEPKLDSFLLNLSDTDFSLKELAENRDELEELLYYMEASHCKQVTDEIWKLTDSDDEGGKYSKRHIVINLVKLYPLSQDLVREILKGIKNSDQWFCEGVDVDEKVLHILRERLKKAKEDCINSTNRFNDYQKDVEKLADDAKSMEEQASQFQDLRQKNRNLRSALKN